MEVGWQVAEVLAAQHPPREEQGEENARDAQRGNLAAQGELQGAGEDHNEKREQQVGELDQREDDQQREQRQRTPTPGRVGAADQFQAGQHDGELLDGVLVRKPEHEKEEQEEDAAVTRELEGMPVNEYRHHERLAQLPADQRAPAAAPEGFAHGPAQRAVGEDNLGAKLAAFHEEAAAEKPVELGGLGGGGGCGFHEGRDVLGPAGGRV